MNVARPLNESEAGVDLPLLQTSMVFLCKSCCNASELLFTKEKQWGLYQSKVNSSLAFSQRPRNRAQNCKMVYWLLLTIEINDWLGSIRSCVAGPLVWGLRMALHIHVMSLPAYVVVTPLTGTIPLSIPIPADTWNTNFPKESIRLKEVTCAAHGFFTYFESATKNRNIRTTPHIIPTELSRKTSVT